MEAMQFMQAIMDECTHLRNFSVPFDTSLAVVIAAQYDAYIPKQGLMSMEDIWPGAQVQYLDAGHVGAYIYYLKLFRWVTLFLINTGKQTHNHFLSRKCIVQVFHKAIQSW